MQKMEYLDLSIVQHREQLQQLLVNSVSILCRKAVSFKSKISIEGLLGITVDSETVLLVNVNELLLKPEPDDCRRDDGDRKEFDPGSDVCVRSSSSRRKSRVTRKAVFNLENDEVNSDSDLNADWNVGCNGVVDGLASDVPLNLVKCEFNQAAEAATVAVPKPSGTQEGGAVVDHEEMALDGDKFNEDSPTGSKSISTVVSNTELNHSWPLPSMQQGNIRKYGSYGYIINQGNDVVFSCNQCPKIFRNRVSLWRHGVKHKMMQGGAPSLKGAVPPANSVHLNQTQTGTDYKPSQLAVMQTNLLNYQHKLGIKSSPVSTYGVLSHYGKKTWYSCIICQDKFLNKPSLWKHRSQHAALAELDHSFRPGVGEAVAFTATTDKSSASIGQDVIPESAQEDAEVNGSSPKPESKSPPSLIELHMNVDQNYNIPDEGDAMSGKLGRAGLAANGVHSVIGAKDVKTVVKTSSVKPQLPPGLLPPGVPEDANVRLIGRYGFVVTTAEGKLYNCIDCSKSFRNRVSLWKHQAKHQ